MGARVRDRCYPNAARPVGKDWQVYKPGRMGVPRGVRIQVLISPYPGYDSHRLSSLDDVYSNRESEVWDVRTGL